MLVKNLLIKRHYPKRLVTSLNWLVKSEFKIFLHQLKSMNIDNIFYILFTLTTNILTQPESN